jgi:ABC-type phosphate transport system substrate-binding protein
MRNFLKASFALGVTVVALSANANAQKVQASGLGSSGLFLELGLGANSNKGSVQAPCVWSENTSSVVATDTSTGTSLQDKGSAWVAWQKNGGTCEQPGPNAAVFAYLQTDSVVGNRCLFNANLATPQCSIAYPTTVPAPAGLILGTAGEVALPEVIANLLNAHKVNFAGTDIRPEDAEFAIDRALKPCGGAVVAGSQYQGLGYTNGSTIASDFSGSLFNVINFTLPTNFAVTPVGATPQVIVVNGNGDSTGFSQSGITNLSSAALAFFLDGTYSYADQALSSPSASGDAVTTILREPLSGTYNTMEYNVPNTTTQKTSQDVGKTQPAAQKNCSGTAVKTNPLHIATPSGGARRRAIGTGQELAEVIANPNSLGYSFWSTANFAGFTAVAAPDAKYLTIDGIDPLLSSSATYTGTVPVTGSTDLANVDLHTTANGTYPIWSLLRLVNVGSTPLTAVNNLATSAQLFVSFGSSTSRPDFIVPSSLTVVRSHFKTPVGLGEPAAVANGHVGLPASACTAPESGGDVGGVVLTLRSDSAFCTDNDVTTGQTGQRR